MRADQELEIWARPCSCCSHQPLWALITTKEALLTEGGNHKCFIPSLPELEVGEGQLPEAMAAYKS